MPNTHTISAYDRELKQLTHTIIEMGDLVKALLRMGVEGLDAPRQDLAEKAVETDKRINALDASVEQQATAMLALRNPMAVDLRLVTSAIKMAVVFERMGDIAKKIVKRTVKLGDYRPAHVMEPLHLMAEMVEKMIDQAMDAIARYDAEAARQVFDQDDAVDELYQDMLTNLQRDMVADPQNAAPYTLMIFLAKNYERLGDYAANLAKSVNYVASGDRRFGEGA
jgi:phosphate transport system protein